MNKENTFKVIDKDGKEINFEVLFTFESDETGKNYMVYTDDTLDDDGNTKVYASVFNPNKEPLELLPVETEREWKVIETILGSIMEDDKKNKELGLITFVLLANEKTNSNEKLNRNSFSRPDNIEIVQIEMTQEEVLQLGYLPEELGWEKKKKALIISDRSILIKGDNKIDIEKNNVDDTHKNECDKILDFHEKMKVRDNGSINEKNKITNGNMAKNNRELKNNEKDIGD